MHKMLRDARASVPRLSSVLVIAVVSIVTVTLTAQAEIRCAGQRVAWRVRSKTIASRTNTIRAGASKNAYAVSRQRIRGGDGCISFNAPGSALERIVGMAKTGKIRGAEDFLAAVHLEARGRLSLIINGRQSDEQLRYRPGDRFFISFNEGVVEFWRNGRVLESAYLSAKSPLSFAAAFRKAGAAVGSARIGSGPCRRWLVNHKCGRGRSAPEPTGPSAAEPPVTPSSPPAPPPAQTAAATPTIASGIPPVWTPKVTVTAPISPTSIPGAIYYVSTLGSDANNGTSLNTAWRTVGKAASSAAANSTVLIRAGTYNELVTINRSNLTFQGYPGDTRPVITSTVNSDSSTILIGTGASNVALRDLEISGGYYSLKFDSTWSNGGGGTGPQRILIDRCLLHDSASHIVKIQPKADQITIQNSELHRSGRRSGLEGQGVDAVNVGNFTFQDNYVHDTSHTCLFTKGGAVNSLVQRNAMINCGWSGILLGQDTGRSFMDSALNPTLYECVNCTARNNIVINTGYAGIGSYSANGTKIYSNTIINSSGLGQAAIFLSSATVGHTGPAGVNYDIRGNIITVASSNRQALSIAPGAYSGTPSMNDNVYFTNGGGVAFVDNRGGGSRSLSAWKSATGQDSNSVETNPGLTAPQLYGNNVYPSTTSPALNRSQNLSGSGYTDDYSGNTRPAGSWDSGAIQHS